MLNVNIGIDEGGIEKGMSSAWSVQGDVLETGWSETYCVALSQVLLLEQISDSPDVT